MTAETVRYDVRYDQWCGWLLGLLGSGRRYSRVLVTRTGLDVQLGLAFRALVPRSSIRAARRWRGRVYGWGAHGWRGRWLVNGSSKGIVVFQLDPPATGRVVGFKVKIRELAVSLEDPEGLCQALEVPLEAA